MLQLIMRTPDEFEVRSDVYSLYVRGSFVDAFKAMRRIGVHPSEFVLAVEQMLEKGHNFADFGIYKSFIFTKKVELPSLVTQ